VTLLTGGNFWNDWLTNGLFFTDSIDNTRNPSFLFDAPKCTDLTWSIDAIAVTSYATKDNAFIEIAAAGYTKKDITIDILDNKLTISAPKIDRNEGIQLDGFNKTYILNSTYDVDNISAKFVNGLLTITIPFIEKENTSSKQITIK
tara:strand:+ start:17458 stop:17895 length:438 start_codon:yes stop_codon:yes gene_type:complete